MIFDPVYWLVIGLGMALSFWASSLVKSRFDRYSRMPTRSHMSGAEVARAILRDHDIHDVQVEPVAGDLSDHYDPRTRTLRLSERVYGSNSMAAFGVAAHEVGHALQHARSYAPLNFRSAWVPLATTGSSLSTFVLIAAAFMGGAVSGGELGYLLSIAGVSLFALTTIFTLITLPVEFDASRRALLTLEQGGYVTADERDGAKKVLDAAAMTYVAAFATSLMTLIYWVMQLGLFGNRDE